MTTPTDAELLPCPFCGSKEASVADDLITFYGECGSCGSTAAYSSYKDGAVQAWNRRAPQAVAGVEPVGFANAGQLDNIADGYAYLYPKEGPGAHVPLYTGPPPQAVREPQPMPDLTRLTERGAEAWVGVDAQVLRAGREPLTDEQVRRWWERDNGLEDCELCKLGDFMKAVRAVEAAHGITKGGQHG